MKYDKEKVDKYTLALLFLVIHERKEGFGARAWKGFDWDTMNRLHEKSLITDPVSKAKSVGLTEEGYRKSEMLFKKFFARNNAMAIKFDDIEHAFFYVNAAPMTSNTAILCKETGQIFYASDYDDENEIPEEIYFREDCIQIPHRNDLELGRNLVFEFVEQYLPGDFDRVRDMFRKKGAYGRYKDLLDDRGFLQKWYDFEDNRQTETLREWCKDNNIMLSD